MHGRQQMHLDDFWLLSTGGATSKQSSIPVFAHCKCVFVVLCHFDILKQLCSSDLVHMHVGELEHCFSKLLFY